jgi:ketosteroid isomerase-like protein
MTDEDAVLAANRAFYRAFAGRDFDAVQSLWSKARPVACIHPGWPRLIGLDAVLQSFADILSNPESPTVHARNEKVLAIDEVALVLCDEIVGQSVLAATNVFALDPEGWRMVHHQAGPVAGPLRPPLQAEPSRSLH